jgi:hypothetical protein
VVKESGENTVLRSQNKTRKQQEEDSRREKKRIIESKYIRGHRKKRSEFWLKTEGPV